MVSVILPTYNEVDNIRQIIPMIHETLVAAGLEFEIIVVDDDSPDGTAREASRLAARFPVVVCKRVGDRGLATAVLKGFELSKGEICVVMDSDMSHPVSTIPQMVRPILAGEADATVGTRYMEGGGHEEWPWFRRAMSHGAGLLARGVTTLSDPTSGYMAIRRDRLAGAGLDPVGWKIVLEAVVKTNPRLLEIPIVFADRREGVSKLDAKAQVDYLHHLWKLYRYKYRTWAEFLAFCLVGGSGVLVDTAILVSLVEFLSLTPIVAAVFAFLVAVSWNYRWNSAWTFRGVARRKRVMAYFTFVAVCLAGLLVRVSMMHLLMVYAGMGERPWYVLASLAGILAATVFNFLGAKWLVFRESGLG